MTKNNNLCALIYIHTYTFIYICIFKYREENQFRTTDSSRRYFTALLSTICILYVPTFEIYVRFIVNLPIVIAPHENKTTS